MSILTVHIGNSEIAIGAFSEKGELLFKSALSSDLRLTADQYTIQFREVLKLYNKENNDIKGTILSSVVPTMTSTVADSMKRLFGRYPILVGPGVKSGLNIVVENPAELGSDLVAESVSALSRYKPPIILVDIGTATVVSAIDQKGSYLGCTIFPGIEISCEALSSKAALLPKIGVKAADRVIGRNSAESMSAGILFGTSAMIDGIIDRMEEEIGTAMIIATGAYAKSLYTYCRHSILCDEDLLLDGLFRIYSKNTQRKVSEIH